MCSRERKMTHVARKAPPPPVCGFMICCGEHFEQNCSACHWRRLTALSAALHPMCIICRHTHNCVFLLEKMQTDNGSVMLLEGIGCTRRVVLALQRRASFFLCSAYMGWRPRRRRGIVELYSLICETLFALFTIAKNCWRNGVFSFTFHPRRIFWLLPTCGNSTTAKSMPRVHCRIASRRRANKQFGHLLRCE